MKACSSPQRRRLFLAPLMAALASPLVRSRENIQSYRWEMGTSYPRQTISGEGIDRFGALVNERSNGILKVVARFNVTAEKSYGLQANDAFSGALAKVNPIFELASLPLLATTTLDARQLLTEARSGYEAAFRALGRQMLYAVPWPPSGLWSAIPVEHVSDLGRLAVRTYDDMSASVFRKVGANATSLSMSQALPQVRNGAINAVLSSGDGSIGPELARFLPFFTPIGYAVPLSFGTVRTKMYDTLDVSTRRIVDIAALQAEETAWRNIERRIADNDANVRAAGALIQDASVPEITRALRSAGEPFVEECKRRIGIRGEKILMRYGFEEDRKL